MSGTGEKRQESHWIALIDLVRPHRAAMSVMSLVLSIAGALPLVGPILVAIFIDRAAEGATRSELTVIASIYVVLGLLRSLFSVLVAWAATDLSWRVTNELRSDLARHVLSLDLAFHRSTSPGELVSRVDGDVTALSDFIARFAVKVIAAMVTLVGLVVVLLVRDFRVGVGLGLYLAIAIGTVWRLRNRAAGEAADEQSALGLLCGEVEERLTGADDLRSNGGGSHAVATFQRASERMLRASMSRERQGVALWIISNAVFVIGGLAAIGFSAVLLSNGSITLGSAFLLFQYTQLLRRPLSNLADETERVQRAAGGMIRTMQLLDESSSLEGATVTGGVLPAGPLGVELNDVDFEYADEDDAARIITDLTFRLAPGQTLGVLGRTGSGKTTLARLLLRLVDPTSGTIRLGDVPLGDVPFEELRRRTGVVSQDVHLFGASIRDNVTLFDDSIGDDQIHAALDELGLLDWVQEMPQGVDTELGPAGAGLSAGEGQLIALTRLFLRQPDFVLLDEASSRIDPATEARITGAIDRLLGGDRTAIVIAHRLSTVERLDQLMILDAGHIVEQGAPSTLRDDPASHYRRLLEVGSDAAFDEVLAVEGQR